MKIYIYKGGLSLVAKSGVGSAIRHQEKMLRAAKVTVTDVWKEADIVQINTVLPDSPLVARRARRQGKKVVYYGHSTMEDFKNSFIGSNLAAPLFKKWIRHCYRQGDVVITPTEYSRELLMKYDLHREIYALTNGVDTEFFHKTEQAGGRFRIFFHLPVDKKVVISAGHLIHRKGIEDFLEMAKRMPDIIFLWFGGGNMQRSLRFRSPFHWTCLFQNFEKWQGALSRSRDKPAESSHATGKPSYILDALWCFNLLNGLDLIWIRLNPVL